jgi:predicted MFS family arabinose efflux permease
MSTKTEFITENNLEEVGRNNDKTLVMSLFAILFLVYTENFIIAPLLTQLAYDLSMSVSLSSNLVTVYTLAVGFGALLYGPISDKVGRHKSIVFSLGGFSVATFLCGQAWDAESVFILRAACGALAGILVSNTFAYVGDYCMTRKTPADIPVLMGKVMSGMFAAIVFGVPLGILAGHIADWRMAFMMLGLATLLLCLIFIYFVENIEKDNVTNKSSTGYFKSLLEYFVFIKNPDLLRITALFFLFQLVVTAFGTFSPIWILDQGYTLGDLAIIYGITGFISTLFAIKSGSIVAKYGVKKTIVVSNAIVMTVLFLIATLSFNVFLVTALMTVYLSFVSLRIAPLQALTAASTNMMQRGRFMSLNSFSMQIGSSLGVFAFSLIMAAESFDESQFYSAICALSVVTLITLLLSLTIKKS